MVHRGILAKNGPARSSQISARNGPAPFVKPEIYNPDKHALRVCYHCATSQLTGKLILTQTDTFYFQGSRDIFYNEVLLKILLKISNWKIEHEAILVSDVVFICFEQHSTI